MNKCECPVEGHVIGCENDLFTKIAAGQERQSATLTASPAEEPSVPAPAAASDTPRTDANWKGFYRPQDDLRYTTSQQLERELAAANAALNSADFNVAKLVEQLAAERKAKESLIAVVKEYVAAYDNASDPQAVGSTCRLIRAESEIRYWLKDNT